ncbi:uncharacterized protein LOC111888323 [Lactuca sativa]|uniref:AMP deaminase n=1 Tax=Lactuca sativa TaxID=4236 RepID=A0A9R1WAG8_LACSA|nr:uncharacterized protein LOC111888323 [Lactuca sativa]KAJ0220318.1 hypothetical protein LSAT_V11C200067440 [Lactuca sativa]
MAWFMFMQINKREEPDEVLIFHDGTYLTLKEVFESLYGLDLNVDLLDVHADKSTLHHFDKFNLKYNPCGQSRLREIFLKQDNLIPGLFLAEVTSQVFVDLEASKYQGIRAKLVSKDFAPKWDIPNLDIPTSEPELNLPITLREHFHVNFLVIWQNEIADAFAKKYSYAQVVKRIPLVLAEIKNAVKSIHDNGGGKFWVPKTDWFIVVLNS